MAAGRVPFSNLDPIDAYVARKGLLQGDQKVRCIGRDGGVGDDLRRQPGPSVELARLGRPAPRGEWLRLAERRSLGPTAHAELKGIAVRCCRRLDIHPSAGLDRLEGSGPVARDSEGQALQHQCAPRTAELEVTIPEVGVRLKCWIARVGDPDEGLPVGRERSLEAAVDEREVRRFVVAQTRLIEVNRARRRDDDAGCRRRRGGGQASGVPERLRSDPYPTVARHRGRCDQRRTRNRVGARSVRRDLDS